jgi:hypothetical protein
MTFLIILNMGLTLNKGNYKKVIFFMDLIYHRAFRLTFFKDEWYRYGMYLMSGHLRKNLTR